MKKTLTHLVVLIVISLAASGCIPTIQRQWDVQPVSGTIIDGTTGKPVPGATIRHREQPRLTARSDAQGHFHIDEQSQLGFHLLMPGSAMTTNTWDITHPDYPNGVAQTRTHFPPLDRQLSELKIPLFATLPSSPDTCPYFGYLMQWHHWHQATDKAGSKRLRQPMPLDDCNNDAARNELHKVWFN